MIKKNIEGQFETYSLNRWQELFEKNKNGFTAPSGQHAFVAFDRQNAIYSGSENVGGGRSFSTVWNFPEELIESGIDSHIPLPKVTPRNPNEKTIRGARIIEKLLRSEVERLPFEELNDIDERQVRVNGGTAFFVEWDVFSTKNNRSGELDVRLLSAKQLIPQQGVSDIRQMDYIFLTFDDTKERLFARYKNRSIFDETVDADLSNDSSDIKSDELVTQKIAYYKNSDGRIGCFSWVGDTCLIDQADYEMRKEVFCAVCGDKVIDQNKRCVCGSNKFKVVSKRFETLNKDIEIFEKTNADGTNVLTKIPAFSPVVDNDGIPILEDFDTGEQVFEQDNNGNEIAVYDYVFDKLGMVANDKNGNPIGKKRTKVIKRAVKKPTEIEFYYPSQFPITIRKNISNKDFLYGKSDIDSIAQYYISACRQLTKRNDILLKSGSVVEVPQGTSRRFTNDALTIIESKPENYGKINVVDIKAPTESFEKTANYDYERAKNILGISDSFQGRKDNTAVSGRAKETQIMQVLGRQQSRRIMKNKAYSALYELMFKMLLAYSDGKRTFASKTEDGVAALETFNRYDFIEKGDDGNYYFSDEYLFSVDESGVDFSDKRFMLEMLQRNLDMGAYGQRENPETWVQFWNDMKKLGVPGCSDKIDYWEKQKNVNG